MQKVTFRIRRVKEIPYGDFIRAVIQAGDDFGGVPGLSRYVQHFAPSPYEDGVDGYLELWLEDGGCTQAVLGAPTIQPFLQPGQPFWLEPMEDVAVA